jgi:hypothetical protein
MFWVLLDPSRNRNENQWTRDFVALFGLRDTTLLLRSPFVNLHIRDVGLMI